MDRNTKIRRGFHLPEEIIEQILSKLPVKSLSRFRCVSKSWRSLIGSKSFVNKHLEYSKRNSTFPHWRLISKINYLVTGLRKPYCSTHAASPMDDPANNHLMKYQVLGCYNGVLCVVGDGYFLWNPATRISMELSDPGLGVPHSSEQRFGFGWDEESGAYKVFEGMVDDDNQKIGRVYSSATDSWRWVDCGSVSMSYGIGVFARGGIHWISECGNYVERLDLKSEVFGRMELPHLKRKRKNGAGVGRWLRERGGCLTALYNNNKRRKGLREEEGLLDVWVMAMEEECCSWVKKGSVAIPLEDGGLTSSRTTFCLCNGNEDKVSYFYHEYIYVESLVSPRGRG